MLYTFTFGTSVYAGEKKLGTLKRIIVDNDVASQVTVDPGLLDYERVVPLMDIREATEDRIQLEVPADAWKSYTSFDDAGGLKLPPTDSPYQGEPDTHFVQPEEPAIRDNAPDHTIGRSDIVLSEQTTVVDIDRGGQDSLRGLTVDNGRPLELLLADGDAFLFHDVHELDSDRIEVRSTGR